MKRVILFCLSLVALAAIVGITSPGPVHAGGVVGDGTPASCTEARLDAALATGGSVTFDCGSSPAEIVITSPKVIRANTTISGANLITIRGVADPALHTRLFQVEPGARLELNNITLSGGRTPATADSGADLWGGAIYNQGRVLAVNVTFLDNRAGQGGAIYNNGEAVDIHSSTFTNNQASSGGAIYNAHGVLSVENTRFILNAAHDGAAIFNRSTLFIGSSNFTFNVADSDGGAILSDLKGLRVAGSDFNNNVAQKGGAIAINGNAIGDGPLIATIEDSNFNQNSAMRGGGVYLIDPIDVTISRSTFGANETLKLPEGFDEFDPGYTDPFGGNTLGGGAIYNRGATLTVLDSTFAKNRSRLHGGGIFNVYGPLTVMRSTFSNNRAGKIGGGIFHAPGHWEEHLSVTNSTFSANEAETGGAIGQVDGDTPSETTIRYSTIAYNQASHFAGVSGSVYRIESSILAYNGPGDTCEDPPLYAPGVSFQFPGRSCGGDIYLDDPGLLPLGDWGGFTDTHPLRSSSPALDAVSPCALSNDQRIFSRPGGPACDSGAFELEGEELETPPPAPIVQEEPTPTPPPDEPQTILVCDNFGVTAPRDGLANGPQAFYWTPAPDATSYQLLIYDAENGSLLAIYDIPAPASSTTVDVSSNAIGGGFLLRYELHALYNGQSFCSNEVSLQREPPTPLQGGQPVCGNGICEQGENPNNCQADCK